MIAIRVHETGGADRLRLEEIPVPEPKRGEIRIRVEAIGVNYLETYQRTGLYPMTLPFTPGSEAAGTVSAVGEGVAGFKAGDRVATVRAAGAYAAEAVAPADMAVRSPRGMESRVAAAVLLQGLTAHYLACDSFPLKPGDTALVHAGAGGVGLLLVQIAKRRGARVIATVGTEEKAALARAAGADATVLYTREDFVAAARAFTGGRGVDVVYDGVGKDTFLGGLDSLRPRGMMVTFGNASGPVPPFSPLLLSQKGSLFLTRPTLFHYTRTPAELASRAADLFGWVADGLDVRIGATFPLASAAEAHRALESRATTGKVLLTP
jgi:NADPH2:quinone reductase